MNAILALKTPPSDDRMTAEDEAHLSWLQATLAQNRFLPSPPDENVFVGDGDYRAIGAEFLGHFVRVGGLRRQDRVLDIGCGIGRMAVPLTQYLDPGAAYEGVDPVLEGIAWCSTTITPVYPQFRFCRIDVAHALYNPSGQLAGRDMVLPFSERSFDFVAMVSVATHLPLDEIGAYADEVARLLSPGGRLFMTAFIVSQADVDRAGCRIPFQRAEEPGVWFGNPEAPLAAIGFEDGMLQGALEGAGLVVEKVCLGHWRGTDSGHYQDIVVARRPGRGG